MRTHDPKTNDALAIAAGALALAAYATVRRGAPATPAACVDRDARAELATLRQAVAQRDAMIARMGRAVSAAAAGAAPVDEPPSVEPAPPPAGPPRYVRIDVPNPAVTVTQKDDGSFDIRSADPALAGQVLTITATTAAGAEETYYIRVP